MIDVYRGEQEPVRNVIDYALYIAFFPQLVAGPIVRARIGPSSEEVSLAFLGGTNLTRTLIRKILNA